MPCFDAIAIVAPVVRFSCLAIFSAPIFVLASRFSSRISFCVHGIRIIFDVFDFFFTMQLLKRMHRLVTHRFTNDERYHHQTILLRAFIVDFACFNRAG